MTERIIAQRLGIGLPQVQGTVRLLREGATIPFISRYRKEATGSLDELQVGAIKEQLDRLTELEARRQTVLTTIEGQGKLTGELRKRIEECWNAVELEDIYLPYKPKRPCSYPGCPRIDLRALLRGTPENHHGALQQAPARSGQQAPVWPRMEADS